jgi:hypothetical protein
LELRLAVLARDPEDLAFEVAGLRPELVALAPDLDAVLLLLERLAFALEGPLPFPDRGEDPEDAAELPFELRVDFLPAEELVLA